MGFRNIQISSNTQLHIQNQQLMIGNEGISFPLEDINSIMIENLSLSLSAYFLQKVAEYGIVVYICDEKHIPSTVSLPMVQHCRHFRLLKSQIDLGKPLQKRLWQQVVVQKVKNQAKCLEIMGIQGFQELNRMAKEVQSGDRTHVEAKAAAYYFRCLYGKSFTRDDDHVINSALNYGYAIIRGIIARAIVCYGLEPSIGIFHHSELNSFNLADDMIEVFRPLVDLYVAMHFDMSETESSLSSQNKRDILGIINFDMSLKGEKRIISNCIDMEIMSFSAALQGNRLELDLPELMQLQVHSYE